MGQLEYPDPNLRVSDADRHRVAEILRQAAGEGRLEVDELDQRLEATFAAKTYADLVPITLDLPDGRPSPRPTTTPVYRTGEPTQEKHFAILSGFERKGVWTVPEELTVVAVMGGADLDLRQARFSQPECTFTINAVMGGAQITVPPDVRVVMEGTGIMGGYSGPTDFVELDPNAPTLRIKGVAIMGGVDVRRKPAPPRMLKDR